MTAWQLYWLTRLDEIGVALAIIGLIPFIAAVCHAFGIIADSIEENHERMKKRALALLKTLCFLIPLVVLETFIPSTKQMCAILVLPKIVNSQTANELGGEVVDLARAWLKELKPKAAEGAKK